MNRSRSIDIRESHLNWFILGLNVKSYSIFLSGSGKRDLQTLANLMSWEYRFHVTPIVNRADAERVLSRPYWIRFRDRELTTGRGGYKTVKGESQVKFTPTERGWVSRKSFSHAEWGHKKCKGSFTWELEVLARAWQIGCPDAQDNQKKVLANQN